MRLCSGLVARLIGQVPPHRPRPVRPPCVEPTRGGAGQVDLLTGEGAPVGSDLEEPARVDMVALAKTFEEVRCCGTFFLLMRSP